MKKQKWIFLFISILVVSLTGCSSSSDSNDPEPNYRILYQDSKDATGIIFDHWVHQYNSIGEILSIIDYDNANALKNTTDCDYNAEHKIITKAKYSPEDVLIGYATYDYDSNGILLRWNDYTVSDGSYTSIKRYIDYYFTDGRLTSSDYYSVAPGALLYSTTYSYDGNGNRLKSESTSGNYCNWSYQSNNVIEASIYDSTDALQNIRTFQLEEGVSTEYFFDYLDF